MRIILKSLFIFVLAITSCATKQVNTLDQNLASLDQIKDEADNYKVETKNFVITDTKTPVIKPSNLIERLRKEIEKIPKITGKQLADFGNELIRTEGYDYTFDWEPKGMVNESNLAKLEPNKFYPFIFQFTDVRGKTKTFQLMNDDFDHPCFSVIDIPVTKVNEQMMTIVSDGKEFELKRPKEFYLEEVVLLDDSLKKAVRKWKIPIDATPIGISEDGKKIYFESWEFYQDETAIYNKNSIKLAVEVSEDGNLQLVDSGKIKSDNGTDFDYDKKHTEIIYKKYKVGKNEYNIKYSAPCT